MTGCTFEEVAGHSYSRFFLDDDIKRGRPEELLRLAAASGTQEDQGMRVRKDGTRFLIRTTLTASRDPDGHLRGFSVISRDLSEIEGVGGEVPRADGSGPRRDGGGEHGRRDRAAESSGREAVRIPPRRTARAEGHQHHSGRLRGTADRRRHAIRGRRAGAADRHRHRADRAAQGRQRVSDRTHAEPARQRRRNPGDGGDPRHQRAQGRGKASGADGGPLPRAPGGRAGCDGGGEHGRRDRAAERAGREAVRLPPRRTRRAEGHHHHSGGLRRTADRRRSSTSRTTRRRSRSARASNSSNARRTGAGVSDRTLREPAGKPKEPW